MTVLFKQASLTYLPQPSGLVLGQSPVMKLRTGLNFKKSQIAGFGVMLIPALGETSSWSMEQLVIKGKVSCKGHRGAAMGPGAFAGRIFALRPHCSSLKALLGRALACQCVCMCVGSVMSYSL